MSAIQNLEYLKYFTLRGKKFNIGFRSKGSFTDLIGSETFIQTPEGLEFIIKSIRIDFGSFSFTDDENDLNYLYKFDLGNVMENSWNDVNRFMIPNFFVDSTFEDVNYKSYVFISDYYRNINLKKPDLITSWKHEYMDNNPGCDKYPHSMVIVVKATDTDDFESFMNFNYYSWKIKLDDAIDEAIIDKNTIKLSKYHPSIFSYEITFDQIKSLLEDFETLELSSEVILALLKSKDKVIAVKLMNYLRNSTTNINLRLYQYFIEPFNVDYFIKYNEALMELGLIAIDRNEIETIAVNEVNTYIEHQDADWNIFNKLAENAGVFVISTKPVYTSHFGIFNYFPKGATININPFNTEFLPDLLNIPEVKVNKTKIHFGYSALIKGKPIGSTSETIIRFPEYDPFKIVKLYIVEEPKELKYVDNYKGFLDVFFTAPDRSKVKYVYLPAICAYNFYLLNFVNHHDEVQKALIKGAILTAGLVFTSELAPLTIPWFLGTATSVVGLTTLLLDSPGIKEEILSNGQDGQDFIDAWHTLEQVTIALDFAYAGFYGIKNLTYLIANKEVITLAKEVFRLKYLKFNLRIREILAPFYKSVYKNLEEALIEAAEYEALLTPHLLPGKTWAWVVEQRIINGVYPELSSYIKSESIVEFNSLLQSEGVSFFITKREIEKYTEILPEKFAGIQSHMNIVESNFIKSGNNTGQLMKDLSVGENKFLHSDIIYHVKVKNIDGITLKVPNGNSKGSINNLDWRPFGFLKPFKNLSTGETVFAREAIFLVDEANLTYNGFSEFVSKFGDNSNVIQIYP